MKRCLSLFLILLLLPFCALAQKGFGEYARDGVNVRKTPGGDILFKKQQGEEVFIRGQKEYRGRTWYEVSTYDAQRVNPFCAWVQADMIVPPETLFRDVVQVAAYMEHMIALKKDGTVVYGGQQHQYESSMSGEHPRTWRNVKQVAVGFLTVYGLKEDGSLYCWGIRGPQSGLRGVETGDGHTVPFASISAQSDTFVGLMADGSLYVLWGNNALQLLPPGSNVEHACAWMSIYADAVFVQGGAAGALYTLNDSAFSLNDREKLAAWSGLTQIAAGCRTPGAGGGSQAEKGVPLIAGLRKDGTVIALGEAMNKEVQGWSNVAKLSFGDGFLLGLTKDGQVLAAGKIKSAVADEVRAWRGVVDIACGFDYCVGVTRDGTLLFAGTAAFGHG